MKRFTDFKKVSALKTVHTRRFQSQPSDINITAGTLALHLDKHFIISDKFSTQAVQLNENTKPI